MALFEFIISLIGALVGLILRLFGYKPKESNYQDTDEGNSGWG